jgi:hypothetical protein
MDYKDNPLYLDMVSRGKMTRIEDHGTIVVAWLEENGTESIVYFDHSQFQNLIDAYGDTLMEEEFIYDGEVLWTTKDVE